MIDRTCQNIDFFSQLARPPLGAWLRSWHRPRRCKIASFWEAAQAAGRQEKPRGRPGLSGVDDKGRCYACPNLAARVGRLSLTGIRQASRQAAPPWVRSNQGALCKKDKDGHDLGTLRIGSRVLHGSTVFVDRNRHNGALVDRVWHLTSCRQR